MGNGVSAEGVEGGVPGDRSVSPNGSPRGSGEGVPTNVMSAGRAPPPPQGRHSDDEDQAEWANERERLNRALREKKEREAAEKRERDERERREHEGGMRQTNQDSAMPTASSNSAQAAASAAANADGEKKKKKLLNGTNIEYKYPSGSRYIGGFKDGKLHGFGKYFYHPSGDVYEGEWLMDMKHGQGTYTYEGGDRYNGEWRSGKKHGKGTYTFATGDEYVGNWKEDKIHGYGVFTIARNGNRYEGNWEESYRHGQGTLRSGTGDVYTGLWVKGKEEGLGTLLYANGNVYAGEWRAGQMDGKGILREKGQKHTVEHIAGYLIAKVPVEPDAEVDPDWNAANRLYKSVTSQGPGTTGQTAQPVSKADDTQLTKLKLEKEMWEKKYNDLLSKKAGSGGEDKERDLTDTSALHKRIEELKEQRDAEKQRADDYVARERVLKAEIEELNFVAENLRKEMAAKQFESGSGEEMERLQRRCAELEREVNARKQRESAAAGAPKDDPVELRVKLELAEGELRSLRTIRDESRKLREQHLDAQRTIAGLEARNEELVKEMTVQRARASHLQGQIADTTAQTQQQQEAELTQLRTDLNEAKAQLVVLEDKNKKSRKNVEMLEQKARRADDLEAEVLRLNKLKLGDAELNKNLDKKMDLVENLRKQNAELQRQLEEMQVEEVATTRKKSKKGKGDDDDLGNGGNAEQSAMIEQLQAELKKEKKKLKKASQDRDAIAQELYEEQLKHARTDRTLQCSRGRVNVVGKIRPLTQIEQRDGCEAVITVNPEDTSQILVAEAGASKPTVFQFDTCLPAEAASKDVFEELRGSVVDVCDGHHAALVVTGAIGAGKTTILSELFPQLVEELFQQLSLRHTANTVVSVKLSCVEICSDGLFDCNSGTEILHVVNSQFDNVVPAGATTVPCSSPAEAVTKMKVLLSRRRKANKRSHMWIQFATEVKHKIQQTKLLGHYTIVDLAGAGPLSMQEDDIDSAKFVNTSMTKLSVLIDALQSDAQAVPYLESKLNSMLSDVFGGNCLTTVLACFGPTAEQVNDNLQQLHMAQKALSITNRPIIQSFVSVEDMRLRELVLQHVGEDQAMPQLKELSSVRQA